MKRKISIPATIMMVAFALTSIAQSVELTPIGGYTFQSTKNYAGGQTRVHDGFTYGGALTVNASPFNAIEVSYYRYETDATAHTNYIGYMEFSGPVAVNYMFIGGKRLFTANDKVTGFTGVNLGAGWMSSENGKFSTMTKFAMGFDAGVKIMASEKVGIRLQTNIYFPITSTGGSFYVGTGGTGMAMYGYVPMWSFGFNGGLIFKLK
jgi:hypothetical protein